MLFAVYTHGCVLHYCITLVVLIRGCTQCCVAQGVAHSFVFAQTVLHKVLHGVAEGVAQGVVCLLYTSPSPRD